MYDFKEKIALVTGGAQGIGFNCIKELLRNGVQAVTVVDINPTQGDEAVKELTQEFGSNRAIFVQADVTQSDQLEAAFKTAIDKWKKLDILVNNAGIFNDAKWEMEIAINCGGTIRGTLLGFQYMSKDKGGNGGVIVNVASRLSFLVVSSSPVYAATKSFVLEFSRCVGTPYQYNRTGIKVLVMCPGTTDTPLIKPTGEIRILSEIIPDKEKAFAELLDDPPQPVENVAKGLITIITEGNSGSVWLVAGNKPAHEIVMPDKKILEKH